MINFTLYTSGMTGIKANTLYPNKVNVINEATLKQAVQYDHVMAAYQDNKRSKVNFLFSDVLPLDCDNDHSDIEAEWVTPLEVAMAFPDVNFAVVYSRNHEKDKGTKTARPRFHVYFPIAQVTDADDYARMKQAAVSAFTYFDDNAKDAARFLFGTPNPEVEFYKGTKDIDVLLEVDSFAEWDSEQHQITEGGRNNAMSHIAGKLIIRYGATDEAHNEFLKEAEKCNPPLETEELATIWASAVNFGKQAAKQEGYIPPEVYNAECALKPTDFSDVGQATVLAREYGAVLRYSPATKFLVYNGSFWEESEPKAQAIEQALTLKQLQEAEIEIEKLMKEMVKNGAFPLLVALGNKKAVQQFNPVQRASFDRYNDVLEYKKFVVKRRDSNYINNALKEVMPMLEIDPRQMDTDPFSLNTPSNTYDLRTGKAKQHNSLDFITKQTRVDPDDKNMNIWLEAVNGFFGNDQILIDYIQANVGMAFIGKVLKEAMFIAYGDGGNGKSTFWNVLSMVSGTYGGTISSDILTVGCRRNVKPELAEAKGKRLIIAAELQEGMRLSTANVKQLCSTDEITAEKKFKDPFSYTPTHTLVLYTNHLPKVGASDDGTWRRLIVVPFTEKIDQKKDVKNYAEYLFSHSGGAILKWIIAGAKRAIELDYHIPIPDKVQKAIDEYKESNDWFGHFLNECCELDEKFEQKSGEFYSEYRVYCMRIGEYTRNTSDFYAALELAGYKRQKTKKGIYIKGLRLKSEFEI